MRHLKAHRKLGRTTEHRVSMLRNMATSLIISENSASGGADLSATVSAMPTRVDIDPTINEQLIVELYSK
jgi:ribosomal protein L17